MKVKREHYDSIMKLNLNKELVSLCFKNGNEKILISINSFDITFTTTFISLSVMNNVFTNYLLEKGNGNHLLNGFSQENFVHNKTMITHHGTQILILNSHFEEIISSFKSSHFDDEKILVPLKSTRYK